MISVITQTAMNMTKCEYHNADVKNVVVCMNCLTAMVIIKTDGAGFIINQEQLETKELIVCDITMCCNYDCPLKGKCYRYRAVPDGDYQSFALFKFCDTSPQNQTECDHFWPVDEAKDHTLSTQIVDNRYERDGNWKGII